MCACGDLSISVKCLERKRKAALSPAPQSSGKCIKHKPQLRPLKRGQYFLMRLLAAFEVWLSAEETSFFNDSSIGVAGVDDNVREPSVRPASVAL